MLQSPAPALIKMDPPLSGPSMKARSLMVPSCMLNSRSGPKSEAHIGVKTVRSISGDTTFHYFLVISTNHFDYDSSDWTPFQKKTNALRRVGDHYSIYSRQVSGWKNEEHLYTLKHIKVYLWHCSCLHWKAGLWQIYHWSQWPTVFHSGSRQHNRSSPCGVCSSWSVPSAVWLHQDCWKDRDRQTMKRIQF